MTTLQEPIPVMQPAAVKSRANEIAAKPNRAVRVAVVDDDDDFRRSLCFHLSDQGIEPIACSGGRAALELLGGEPVDVVLLDWRMPDMNGLEVLRELRQRGTMTPVIFLTGLADEVFEEAALAGGAVDFIDKSRRLSILVRRIELIAEGQRPLPDASLPPPSQLRLGQLELRFDINRAFWRGAAVDLTLTEFRMIAQLAMRPGEDVSYRELYDLVHGKDFIAGCGSDGYRTNVRTFIKRIRRKFREIDGTFDSIENYARFGYRWTTQQ
jgi:two-component system, OmpR family, response regulator ChvI